VRAAQRYESGCALPEESPGGTLANGLWVSDTRAMEQRPPPEAPLDQGMTLLRQALISANLEAFRAALHPGASE